MHFILFYFFDFMHFIFFLDFMHFIHFYAFFILAVYSSTLELFIVTLTFPLKLFIKLLTHTKNYHASSLNQETVLQRSNKTRNEIFYKNLNNRNDCGIKSEI